MHFFCSVMSGQYSYQGVVLYNSIKKYDEYFKIFYLCIDNLAYEIFSALKLENVILIKAEEIESYFTELKEAKTNRAINEYAWTLKSSEMLYIFDKYEEVDRLIWLDGDIQMLANPQTIYDEWGSKSIILTEQYYTGWHEPLIKTYGRFQAGFIGFCRTNEGLECLRWWQRKCIEWCYVRFEEGRWADQKYLDIVPEEFPNTCIVKSLGINMTPFVLYRFNFEDEKYIEAKSDGLYINNVKVVLFHYYGYKYIDDSTFDLCSYWMKYSSNTIESLYIPYIKACKAAIVEIESIKKDYRQSWDYKGRRIANYFDFSRYNHNACYDFATIVRKDTLKEAIAQYYSILRYEDSFYWWVCCADAESYHILKHLKLRNTTVIHIEHVLEGVLREDTKKESFTNKFESLKVYFLYYLLKNNYSVKKLLFLKPDFYLLESVSGVFNYSQDYDVILFNNKRHNSSNQSIEYDRGLIGLLNNKKVVEVIEGCTDSKNLNININLNEKLSKYLQPHTVESLEYACTLNDLKYAKYMIKKDGLYNNNRLIRAFRFKNDRNLNGNIALSSLKIQKHMNKGLYDKIYDPYLKDLNHAMIEIKRFQV